MSDKLERLGIPRETAMEYIDFLRKVPLFAELEEEELEPLAGVVREHHYRKNSTIFHIDDPGNAIARQAVAPIISEPANHDAAGPGWAASAGAQPAGPPGFCAAAVTARSR